MMQSQLQSQFRGKRSSGLQIFSKNLDKLGKHVCICTHIHLEGNKKKMLELMDKMLTSEELG